MTKSKSPVMLLSDAVTAMFCETATKPAVTYGTAPTGTSTPNEPVQCAPVARAVEGSVPTRPAPPIAAHSVAPRSDRARDVAPGSERPCAGAA